MLLPGTKRVVAASLAVSLLALALGVGCAGRWQPSSAHDVATEREPAAAYMVAREAAAAQGYVVLSQDEANKKLRLQAQCNANSFIDVEVTAGIVKLAPAGGLVRGFKVHKTLANEVNNFELELKQRIGSGAVAVASASAAPVSGGAPVEAAGTPVAWTESANDPSVWGNGSFTCLPVAVPAEHQAALSLQLSNGEKADLLLSLQYAPGLCRSPAQCRVPGGCPALGIGDPERVSRIAGRLSRGEIGGQALLLDSGKPVVNVDLAHHGTVQQALTEIKH